MGDISKGSNVYFFFIEQVALELRMFISLICLKQKQSPALSISVA